MKRLISLLLLFCIGLPLLAQQQRPAQTPKRDQKKKEVAEIDTIPLYNGTYVGVDLYGVGSKLLGGDFIFYMKRIYLVRLPVAIGRRLYEF